MLKKFNFAAFSVLCVSLLTIFGFEIFAVAQMAIQSNVALSYELPSQSNLPTGPIDFTNHTTLGDVCADLILDDDGQPVVPSDPAQYPKLKYTSNGDGTCSVSQINPLLTTGDIVIPKKSPAGDTVTSISSYGFAQCVDLTSVTLDGWEDGNTIDDLGFQSFRDCVSLTTVNVPVSSLNAYRGGLFYNCPNFQSCNEYQSGDVIIRDSMTVYGEMLDESITIGPAIALAFPGASLDRLGEEIEGVGKVNAIGPYAFAGVPIGVEDAEFFDLCENYGGRGVTYIGIHAFEASITASILYLSDYGYPDSSDFQATIIESGAFAFCKIEEFIIDNYGYNTMQKYWVDNNILYESSTCYAVACGTTVTEANLNYDICYGAYPFAFAGSNVGNIIIGPSTTYIGEGAFAGCGGDYSVDLSNSEIDSSCRYTTLGTSLIFDTNENILVHVFANADMSALAEAEYFSIGDYACYKVNFSNGGGNWDMAELFASERVEGVGDFAFYLAYTNSSYSNTITFKGAGDYAFYGWYDDAIDTIRLQSDYNFEQGRYTNLGDNAFMAYTPNKVGMINSFVLYYQNSYEGTIDEFEFDSGGDISGVCTVTGVQQGMNIPGVSPLGEYVLEAV